MLTTQTTILNTKTSDRSARKDDDFSLHENFSLSAEGKQPVGQMKKSKLAGVSIKETAGGGGQNRNARQNQLNTTALPKTNTDRLNRPPSISIAKVIRLSEEKTKPCRRS